MRKQVARALRHVPTVYFYVPAVRREMGKKAGLRMTEDMCAVLWLTEVATGKGKGALRSSVRRAAGLTEARMSTVLMDLVPEFLTSDDAHNRRSHRLTLTKAGRTLLATIKEEREEFLQDLFRDLTAAEQAACADALTTLETTMWRAIPK